jgi:hypothetical protein
MLVAALFRLDGVPLNVGDVAVDGVAVEVGELDAGEGEDGHVTVGEEVDVAGVVEDSGDIGGDERLAFADADDHGRPEAGGDDLVRFGGGKNAEGECAGETLYGAADGYFEKDRFTGRIRVELDLLNEVGDDFGVGLGDELVAFFNELALEVEVVFDDAVVDDDDAAGAVAVGVGVFFGGASVGGPAGVADAVGTVERMFAQDLFEVDELALGAADLNCGAGGAADGDAGGVIAAIFEAAQALDDGASGSPSSRVSSKHLPWRTSATPA